jgi:RNase adaptor protein for sRNA GlmZ degradation
VGRCLIRRTSGYEEPHRRGHVFWDWRFDLQVQQTKIKYKSSTEAEVVGASDYLPNTLWVKSFMEAQGHEMIENYFEQDNESAIELEKRR